MPDIHQQEWEEIQKNIDTCEYCKSQPLFDTQNIAPARPWNPINHGRLLLISENPPSTGGFWETKENDKLRGNLLRMMNILSRGHHDDDVKSFLAHRYSDQLQFFLIQTLKWPYVKTQKEQKKSYNRLRSSSSMRRMIEHAAAMHLAPEIAAINPIGILAMGRAAWDACRAISINKSDLPDKGTETVRGHPYTLQLSSGTIALNVTHLPVGLNVNFPRREAEIRQDFESFCNRHVCH